MREDAFTKMVNIDKANMLIKKLNDGASREEFGHSHTVTPENAWIHGLRQELSSKQYSIYLYLYIIFIYLGFITHAHWNVPLNHRESEHNILELVEPLNKRYGKEKKREYDRR